MSVSQVYDWRLWIESEFWRCKTETYVMSGRGEVSVSQVYDWRFLCESKFWRFKTETYVMFWMGDVFDTFMLYFVLF